MANVFLAWQNRIDAATLSGGSWSASLPLNNLKSPVMQKVARSTNVLTTSTQFDVDLTASRPIGVVAILAHTLSPSARFRLRGNDSASFTTPAYDSGWIDVYPVGTLPPSALNWEDNNFWFGQLSQDDLIGLQSPFIHILTSEQNLRYWRIELDDGFNTTGYVDIGRVMFARGWRPDVNYSYGTTTNYFDNSPSVTTLSGTAYFDQRPKGRMIRFSLDSMSSTEAYNYALELQRLAGITSEVLMVPDSDDTGLVPLRAFAGRLTTLQGINVPDPSRFSATFELKEII